MLVPYFGLTLQRAYGDAYKEPMEKLSVLTQYTDQNDNLTRWELEIKVDVCKGRRVVMDIGPH
jgi:hypothetical protein